MDQHDQTPEPSSIYRSQDSERAMKTRTWTVGVISGLTQLSLPLLVLIALLATAFSECAAIFTGPKIAAEDAVIHKDRIHYPINAPTEVEDERHLAIMSVDPAGGEPKLEKELERGAEVSIFSSSQPLLSDGERLWQFGRDGVVDLDKDGEPIPYPKGDVRSERPLLFDGKPAVAIVDGRYSDRETISVTVHTLEGGRWTEVTRLETSIEDKTGYDWSGLLVAPLEGGALEAFLKSNKDELIALEKGDGGRYAPKVLARDVNWFDDAPGALFYVTNGPDLDETLDAMDGVEPAGGRTKTLLVQLGPDGEERSSTEAPGLSKFAALVLEDGRSGIVSEDSDITLRVYEGSAVKETRTLGTSSSWGFYGKLLGLGFLWFFGGGLLSLLTALVLTGGMKRHRTAVQTERYASLTQRLIARGIDSTLVVGLCLAVALPLGGGSYLVAAIGLAAGFALALMEGSSGRSPGKLLLGIKVVCQSTGEPPGVGRAVVRAAMLSIDNILGVVGLMSVALTERWQSVGDQVASTIVVRVKKD